MDDILGEEIVIIGDLIMVEVLQGFSTSPDYNTGKLLLESLPFFSLCGKEISLASAKKFLLFKKKWNHSKKSHRYDRCDFLNGKSYSTIA